jgi:hypothetical protein
VKSQLDLLTRNIILLTDQQTEQKRVNLEQQTEQKRVNTQLFADPSAE